MLIKRTRQFSIIIFRRKKTAEFFITEKRQPACTGKNALQANQNHGPPQLIFFKTVSLIRVTRQYYSK